MRRSLLFILVLLAGRPGLALASRASVLPAPLLDYNAHAMTDSCLADCSGLLEAPAGKRGFVVARDGHLWFEEGSRARFFGVNVAKEAVCQPPAVIDRAVEVFAHAGINLVRLHHVDDRYGVLGTGGRLLPERLASLDYWIAQLKERGIYVYLDLLDYRTFTEAEGVPNASRLGRGAKPYAFFDQRLIELQKQYARALLVDHVNPHTGLPYGRDPAVAMVELCDENGLFTRLDWRLLEEPYRSQLRTLWNEWLANRYGSTANLARSWTNYLGQCALGPSESLERRTVGLPRMALGNAPNLDYRQAFNAAARRNDGARFAYHLHRAYFAQMRDYLRSLGVRAPLTATGAMDQPPDLKAVADELDATALNFYWDHPAFGPAAEWRSAGYFSGANPCQGMPPSAFAPVVSAGRIWGKPLVVREWGYCYPNPYRGAGMIEAAAYGALLDVDVMLLFTYQAGDGDRALSYFDVRADPARWGLLSAGAAIFLGGGVTPAQPTLALALGEVDLFNYYSYAHPAWRLAWVAPVGMTFPDQEGAPALPFTVASGRSGATRYLGTNTLMYWNQRNTDSAYRVLDATPERRSGYALAAGPTLTADFLFDGIGYQRGTRCRLVAWPCFRPADLAAHGCRPIGVAGEAALGCYHPGRHNYVFHNLNDRGVLGMALDALAAQGIGEGHLAVDSQCFTAITGEISRDGERGLLKVTAPAVRALAGNLPSTPVALGPGVSISGCPRRGVLVLLALDGQPAAASRSLLVIWSDDAANRGQALRPAGPKSPKELVLAAAGSRPVTTMGRRLAAPLRVQVGGKPVLAAYLQGGAWQVLLDGQEARVWCDTPGATIATPGRRQVMVTGRAP